MDYKPGEEITLSAQRKKHMEKHRQEFSDFDATYERIPEIIAHPDYIGRHPNGQSLEYIKRIDGNVLVAVRLCDKLNVRILFVFFDSKLNLLLEPRICDIIYMRYFNEGGRGSRRTFGSERDAGLSPCRCLSNREVPLGAFLYSKDIISYKTAKSVLSKTKNCI